MHATTNPDRVEAPVTARAYFLCVFASFGGIFFGYDTGWMGGVLAMPFFITLHTGLHAPPPGVTDTSFVIPSWEQSLMTSILSAGTFFGALAAGDVADYFGRRMTIITGCAVFTVGCVLQTASSTGLGLFIAGRLIAGAGVGFISAIIILYLSEIAPRKVRGAIVSGYQFCITIGILLANCVVYASKGRTDSGSYRIPIAVQFLWAIILATGLFLLPESPRWYVKKGRIDAAARSLSIVRGQPTDSDFVQDELAEIVANHEYETELIPQNSYMDSWTACFTGGLRNPGSNLRRTILGTSMQMMQQWTGINLWVTRLSASRVAWADVSIASSTLVPFSSPNSAQSPTLSSSRSSPPSSTCCRPPFRSTPSKGLADESSSSWVQSVWSFVNSSVPFPARSAVPHPSSRLRYRSSVFTSSSLPLPGVLPPGSSSEKSSPSPSDHEVSPCPPRPTGSGTVSSPSSRLTSSTPTRPISVPRSSSFGVVLASSVSFTPISWCGRPRVLPSSKSTE